MKNFNLKIVKIAMKVLFTENISIEPRFWNKLIHNHILSKLKDELIGTCSLKRGYVSNITKVVSINNNSISRFSGMIDCNVTYEAEIFKPKIGHIYKEKISSLTKNGIFININGYVNILIITPNNTLDFRFTDEKTFSNGKEELTVNDEISVRITNIKYEGDIFKCIGQLVDNDDININDDSDDFSDLSDDDNMSDDSSDSSMDVDDELDSDDSDLEISKYTDDIDVSDSDITSDSDKDEVDIPDEIDSDEDEDEDEDDEKDVIYDQDDDEDEDIDEEDDMDLDEESDYD